jgi:putative DNA primase/helicase
VAAACYMLSDGAGKGRLNRDASARRRRTWRAFILSTGESDVAAHVALAGQRLPAGAEVRLPSVPIADAGEVWPALHGRSDFGTLAADLHAAMRRHHGEAGRAFVARLAAERTAGGADLAAALDTMRARTAARLPAGADPQVRDVARRCALVAAAGELAACWGILPWAPGEAEGAAAAMLAAWLARRPGGAGAAEAAAQLERVRLMLIQHAARFTPLRLADDGTWQEADPDRPTLNRIGWRKRAQGRDEFLIPPETWRAEVCGPAGLDGSATARTLAERKVLRRGEGKNLAVKERLPGVTRPVRVYAVSAALLETTADPAEGGGEGAAKGKGA